MAWRWRHGEVGARDNAERRDESGPRPWFQVTPSSLVSLCLLGPLVPLVSAAPPDPSPLRARADRLASISAVSERPSSVPPALLTALRRRPSPLVALCPGSLDRRPPLPPRIPVTSSLLAPAVSCSSSLPCCSHPASCPLRISPSHPALAVRQASPPAPLPIPILFFLLSPSSVASTVIPCR